MKFICMHSNSIEGNQFVRFGSNQLGGVHRFTLIDQKDRLLGPTYFKKI